MDRKSQSMQNHKDLCTFWTGGNFTQTACTLAQEALGIGALITAPEELGVSNLSAVAGKRAESLFDLSFDVHTGCDTLGPTLDIFSMTQKASCLQKALLLCPRKLTPSSQTHAFT